MKRILNYKVVEGDPNEVREGEVLVTYNNAYGSVLAIEKRIKGKLRSVITHVPLPDKFSELPDVSAGTNLPSSITSEDLDNLCSLMPVINDGVSVGYNMLPYNTCAYWSEEPQEGSAMRTIEYHSPTEDISISAAYADGVYISGVYTKQ